MLGQARQGVGEPSLRVDVVELGRLNEGVGDGRRFAARLGADEEVVLPTESNGAHAPLGRVVIQLEDAVLEVRPEPRHPSQRVADRRS